MPRAPSALFDRIPPLLPADAGDLPQPFVYDQSPRALREKAAAHTAKRYVDMMYVSGLDRATADRPRAAGRSPGLGDEPKLAAAGPGGGRLKLSRITVA
jgi:hypothetical protein